LSDKIFSARGKKPCGIVARTGGFMCSAAYWLGSSCEKIFLSKSATVGCIGTIAMFDGDSDETVVVSDLSPNKDPDPKTAKGEELLKAELNALAAVFIDAVARNRGIDREKVVTDFGGGASFIGMDAVNAGLADSVASFEDVVLAMKQTNKEMIPMDPNKKEPANPAQTPATSTPATDDMVQKAVAEERGRVAALQAAFAGTPCEGDLNQFISEGKSVSEANAYLVEKLKECAAKTAPAAAASADPKPADAAREAAAAGQIAPSGDPAAAPTDKERLALYAKRAAARRYRIQA